MLRYVVLEHDWPVRHWDFLLEAGEVLRAWRLQTEPAPGQYVPVEPNFDHRRVYLDYEGPLTGNRGTVHAWDAGVFEWVTDDPRCKVVELRGGKLVGRAELKCDGTGWTFRIR